MARFIGYSKKQKKIFLIVTLVLFVLSMFPVAFSTLGFSTALVLFLIGEILTILLIMTSTRAGKDGKRKKSIGREWFDAIIFAVIAATLIRMFLIEALDRKSVV